MSTYLVSGTSSGIGDAVARLLSNHGNEVVSILRRKRPGGAPSIVADFSKPDQVEQALSSYDFKPIKAFINCAGTTKSHAFHETSVQDLREIFNINVISPMVVLRTIYPHLSENSSVILLGSQSAYKGSHDDTYAASKGAIDSLVKSVAGKLAPKTRVINFAPGITYPTGLTKIMKPELLDKKKAEIPMKRLATPDEMAEIIIFLTTDACRFMTGNTIDVNGGLVLR